MEQRKCLHCGKPLKDENKTEYCGWGHEPEAVEYYRKMANKIIEELEKRSLRGMNGEGI